MPAVGVEPRPASLGVVGPPQSFGFQGVHFKSMRVLGVDERTLA